MIDASRRELLSTVGVVGLGGCLGAPRAESSESTETETETETATTVDVESERALPRSGSVRLEGGLLEISLLRVIDSETVRVIDSESDSLRRLAPSREAWRQLEIRVSNLSDRELSPPGLDRLRAVSRSPGDGRSLVDRSPLEELPEGYGWEQLRPEQLVAPFVESYRTAAREGAVRPGSSLVVAPIYDVLEREHSLGVETADGLDVIERTDP